METIDPSVASLLTALVDAGQLVAEAGRDLADGTLDADELRRLHYAATRLRAELSDRLIPALIRAGAAQ